MTVSSLDRPGAPPRSRGVRLVRMPDAEPPLDPPGTDGALALAETLAAREPRPHLRLVPEPVRTAPGAPPGDPRDAEVTRYARGFVLAALEVLAGQRPLPQLARATSPDVYASLSTLRRRPSRGPRPAVRSVHVARPVPAAVEVCAVVSVAAEVFAVALRLEAAHGRWRCTALEFD